MDSAAKALFSSSFNVLQRDLHQNSKDHGFWNGDNNRNLPTKLMLIVSELAEAMECIRKPVEDYGLSEIQYWSSDGNVYPNQYSEAEIKDREEILKPEGFAIELADAVIRIMDLCCYLGIDLAEAILIKRRYNKSREHMHGGKAF